MYITLGIIALEIMLIAKNIKKELPRPTQKEN